MLGSVNRDFFGHCKVVSRRVRPIDHVYRFRLGIQRRFDLYAVTQFVVNRAVCFVQVRTADDDAGTIERA